MAFGAFYLRDIAGSPKRARWLHLARLGSQSQRAIWFIFPASGASRIIRMAYRLEISFTSVFKNRSSLTRMSFTQLINERKKLLLNAIEFKVVEELESRTSKLPIFAMSNSLYQFNLILLFIKIRSGFNTQFYISR